MHKWYVVRYFGNHLIPQQEFGMSGSLSGAPQRGLGMGGCGKWRVKRRAGDLAGALWRRVGDGIRARDLRKVKNQGSGLGFCVKYIVNRASGSGTRDAPWDPYISRASTRQLLREVPWHKNVIPLDNLRSKFLVARLEAKETLYIRS